MPIPAGPTTVTSRGVAVAAGPILLGAGDIVPGSLALLLLALVPFLVRSLHALSRRWLVLVPAGVVIVDPLILIDPVLVRREQIASMRRSEVADVRAGALDLRIGAVAGSTTITLREPATIGRRQGRSSGQLVSATVLIAAPVRPSALLRTAGTRRMRTA